MTSLFRTIKKKREREPGNSLAVQWLGLHTPTTEGPGLSPAAVHGVTEADTTGCLDNDNREIKSYNFAACPKKKQNNPRPINRKKNDKMVLKWNVNILY